MSTLQGLVVYPSVRGKKVGGKKVGVHALHGPLMKAMLQRSGILMAFKLHRGYIQGIECMIFTNSNIISRVKANSSLSYDYIPSLFELLKCSFVILVAIAVDVPLISLWLYARIYMLIVGWKIPLGDLIGREGPYLETTFMDHFQILLHGCS
nr:uncharacterized membrane protein At3g27390 isoform X1 [Tanacetum cinerariifolium]